MSLNYIFRIKGHNIQLSFSKANEELDVEFFLEKW